MNNTGIMNIIVTIITSVVLATTSISFADEDHSRFSLDYGRLTPAPVDPKAPEPGCVTATYGFSFAKKFKPYVGTGLAYSFQPEDKHGDIKKIKTGVAGQAGFSYLLGENSSLNIDYKYLHVTPDSLQEPPQSLGVGLEIKF